MCTPTGAVINLESLYIDHNTNQALLEWAGEPFKEFLCAGPPEHLLYQALLVIHGKFSVDGFGMVLVQCLTEWMKEKYFGLVSRTVMLVSIISHTIIPWTGPKDNQGVPEDCR